MDRRIRKERFFSKLIRLPITYIILIFLVFLFSYSAIGTYKKSKIAQEKTRQVENELRELKDQEEGLQNSLNDMNSPFGIEKSLREKFGIIKDGEKSVIIVDQKEDLEKESEEEKTGVFGFFKRIF